MHEFVNRLHPNDRVLLVGDRRQHEAVEAGRPFAQLQDAGMKTVKLEEIVRQRDPELKQVVEQLAQGEVQEAIQNLDRQGLHEIQGHDERIAALAKEYAKSPENTLVVSPDNRSRMEINERVHEELQRSGLVSREEQSIRTLLPRQDLTGADRTWAQRYELGDVLRYSRTSKETGIGKGEYAQVKSIDAPKNQLTVELQDGTQRTYDPRRQQGVSVFREEMRNFLVGDRIQFTAAANELRVANRELGTIEGINENGRLRLKMDSGHVVELDTHKHPHLDYGYAMTSHSSQRQTADRVPIHVDTELGAKDLLNSRMAYVSVSRGRYDAQIYTNNAQTLGQELSRDVSHSPAIQQEPVAHKIEPQTTHTNEIAQGFGLGL
jgi:ATP-dependent exoDNAse (exonuclease V) alpha subunit